MRSTTTFAFSCIALSLAACGGGGGSPDLGAPLDLGDDSATVDAGHDAGRDAGRDAGPAFLDGGSDPAALTAAEAAATAAGCTCDYTGEYPSVADCVAVETGSSGAATCLATAFTPPDAAGTAYLACHASVQATYAACITASMCANAARMACNSARTSAAMACPAIPMSVGTAITACIASDVVGTAADSCSDTATASMALGMDVFTGTTIGAGDHRTGSCPAATGGGGAPDVALRWTAPAAGTYTIDTDSTLFDTMLYVLDGCGTTATELACNDDTGGLGFRSSVDVTLTAGQTVQIIVDGYAITSAGNYHVNINGPPAADAGVADAGAIDAGDVDAGTSTDGGAAG
jgi:hypothetical protein